MEQNLANCFSTRAVDFGHLLHSRFARAVEKHNIEHVLVITGTNVTVQSGSKAIVLLKVHYNKNINPSFPMTFQCLLTIHDVLYY